MEVDEFFCGSGGVLGVLGGRAVRFGRRELSEAIIW